MQNHSQQAFENDHLQCEGIRQKRKANNPSLKQVYTERNFTLPTSVLICRMNKNLNPK